MSGEESTETEGEVMPLRTKQSSARYHEAAREIQTKKKGKGEK
jgi:hypothetical protein